MLDIVDQLPNLTGRRCEAFYAQQYWYQGALIDAFNVLFLKIENGLWHRFFFDYPALFWKEYADLESIDTLTTDEHQYPLVDLSPSIPVVRRVITAVEANAVGTTVTVTLRFEGDITLTLESNDQDQKSLWVVMHGERHYI